MITNFSEERKSRLRGMLKFFMGEKNNTKVQVTNGEKVDPCGAIYLTEEILRQFKECMGEEVVELIEE